jgi:hypothetical protein
LPSDGARECLCVTAGGLPAVTDMKGAFRWPRIRLIGRCPISRPGGCLVDQRWVMLTRRITVTGQSGQQRFRVSGGGEAVILSSYPTGRTKEVAMPAEPAPPLNQVTRP